MYTSEVVLQGPINQETTVSDVESATTLDDGRIQIAVEKEPEIIEPGWEFEPPSTLMISWEWSIVELNTAPEYKN